MCKRALRSGGTTRTATGVGTTGDGPVLQGPRLKRDFLPSQVRAVMTLVGQKTLLGGLGWSPRTRHPTRSFVERSGLNGHNVFNHYRIPTHGTHKTLVPCVWLAASVAPYFWKQFPREEQSIYGFVKTARQSILVSPLSKKKKKKKKPGNGDYWGFPKNKPIVLSHFPAFLFEHRLAGLLKGRKIECEHSKTGRGYRSLNLELL